jgi:signal transduction histidine kinase
VKAKARLRMSRSTIPGAAAAPRRSMQRQAGEDMRLSRALQERTRELAEALAQQAATREVLKTISRSTFDLQSVLETLLEKAAGLCAAECGVVYRFDGNLQRFAAAYNMPSELRKFVEANPILPGRGTAAARAVLERRTVHIPDITADPDYRYPAAHALGSIRSILGVPMLREGVATGVMTIWRTEVRPFTDREIDRFTAFADQAAIAIENVRLFNETREALDQQKASAEVLQVIAGSVAETGPVFDKILESCQRLFEGRNVWINLVGEDGAVHLAAYKGADREAFASIYPLPLTRESGSGTAILDRSVAHYPDVEHGDGVPVHTRRGCRPIGVKSVLIAPMLWEGRGIGTVFVGRATVGAFSEKEIRLLKTFANQAVIAIQNARLFHEIEEKSHQLEIANQHKSAFLANMSHELRTPLNAVIGFSQMLAARYFGDLTEKQAEYVDDILASGKHLLSLINDILDLSKVEAGRMELEAADFDLRAMLGNTLTLVSARAQRGGVALRLDIDPALGTWRGDERKLKQVVLNLLSNAVKFTPAGGQVCIAARLLDGSAQIAVSDTGVGIAAQDLDLIFEAFRQVGANPAHKREGTGLGLALARRFVELHGGSIRVESAPGRGSTFTVVLPIRHGE